MVGIIIPVLIGMVLYLPYAVVMDRINKTKEIERENEMKESWK